jgi:hypothetical protein
LTGRARIHRLGKIMKLLKTTLAAAAACLIFSTSARAANEQDFVTLFDGKTFNGWKLVNQHGRGYGIKDGVLFCERGGGGNLFTEKEYENFIFRFEFRLESGSNNGIGIRAPLEGDAAYKAMEIQVLDDTTKKYGPLRPEQMHGSIYGVVGAKTGFQKPLGEWNEEEITADGRHIKVVLNGHTIVDANLNDVSDPKIIQEHPGFLRDRGHIGFLGHTEFAEFRNIRIKELPSNNKDNKAPEGFTALFNGKNLNGWKGAVGNPQKRSAMSQEELAAAQKKADADARKHWKVKDGVLAFDGKGKNLVSAKDYRDFEMLVDWKISPDGDSGIFLRGCPQVQIWDPNSKQGKNDHSVGSGGLHNNEKNPNKPLKRADKPVGEWNRFRIVMTGDRVTVYLNEELVAQNVVMENSVEKGKPIYAIGPIELQSHNTPLWFKNIYIRELNTAKK